MKNKKELDEFISTLMFSWGGDTPPEAIWAVEDFARWLAKEKNTTYNFSLEEFEPDFEGFMEEIQRIWDC